MSNNTATHEASLELIRQHPALAADLLRAFTGLTVSDQADIRLGPDRLNGLGPAGFAPGAVVIVSGPDTGDPRVVVIVEPQNRDNATRQYIWPDYLARVRTAANCPTAVLVVICPDPRAADDCRPVIEVGHGWNLRPVVVDAAAARHVLMKALGVRNLHPTKKQLARLAACTDLDALVRWLGRSLTAATAAEVFTD